MWKSIKQLFGFGEKQIAVLTEKPIEDTVDNTADIVARLVAKPAGPPACGCGRSPTGNCVGLHKLSEEAWATDDRNPNKVAVVVPEVTVITAPITKPKSAKKTSKKSNAKK